MARSARPGAHQALLEAAREEFARRGLERARVEDIARRARISKGAFYLHFRTKEDAFREIVQRFFGALEDHALRRREVEDRIATAHPEHRQAPWLQAECAIDAELLELLWRNRRILVAIDAAAGKLYRDLVGDFRRRMGALIARRIVDRQGAGRLRGDVDPGVIGDIVVGTYEGFARRMADVREKPDLERWARSFLVVLYEGIVERPPTVTAATTPGAPPPPRAASS
jgi:AcrR family transcriptional regulator